jgi:hypothetical protein
MIRPSHRIAKSVRCDRQAASDRVSVRNQRSKGLQSTAIRDISALLRNSLQAGNRLLKIVVTTAQRSRQHRILRIGGISNDSSAFLFGERGLQQSGHLLKLEGQRIGQLRTGGVARCDSGCIEPNRILHAVSLSGTVNLPVPQTWQIAGQKPRGFRDASWQPRRPRRSHLSLTVRLRCCAPARESLAIARRLRRDWSPAPSGRRRADVARRPAGRADRPALTIPAYSRPADPRR